MSGHEPLDGARETIFGAWSQTWSNTWLLCGCSVVTCLETKYRIENMDGRRCVRKGIEEDQSYLDLTWPFRQVTAEKEQCIMKLDCRALEAR